MDKRKQLIELLTKTKAYGVPGLDLDELEHEIEVLANRIEDLFAVNDSSIALN